MLKKILITGGSGFIGTNLVSFYLDSGHTVLNIDILAPKKKEHLSIWKKVDLRDADTLNYTIKTFAPDIIFHLAARTDLNGMTVSDYTANTLGVRNLIKSIKKLTIKPKVIFTSSMLVCKLGYQPKNENDYCPENAYGESKMEGEKIVHSEMNFEYKWAIVRPISIWGPWNGSPYKSFFEAVKNGWYIHPAGNSVLRNYGFVLNTITQLDYISNALGTNKTGLITYLGDYKAIDIFNWAKCIQKELGAPKVKKLPIFIFKFVAIVGDFLTKLGLRFPLTSFRLNNMLTSALYDLTSLKKICPELPYTLEEGVKETVEWYQTYKQEK